MKILLNNREEEFDADTLTVQQLLDLKKYTFRMRTVKVNSRYVPPADYSNKEINDGDSVQVIYLMSGG